MINIIKILIILFLSLTFNNYKLAAETRVAELNGSKIVLRYKLHNTTVKRVLRCRYDYCYGWADGAKFTQNGASFILVTAHKEFRGRIVGDSISGKVLTNRGVSNFTGSISATRYITISQKNSDNTSKLKEEKRKIEEEKRKIEEQKRKIENEKKKIADQRKENKKPVDEKLYPAGSGSGFFVSDKGYLISNHHVIDGCGAITISFMGDTIKAKIIAVDKVNDMAILKTKINPKDIFPVSNEDVFLLEDVVVAGYPLGKELSSSIKTHRGVVTALSGLGDNFSEFQTDATINQGNSGGPVVNQKGNVVGIAVKLLPASAGQNIFFAIKSSTLKQFALSNNLNFQTPNNKELTNKELGKLITDATVFIECWMTLAKIEEEIAKENNRKAFYEKYKK